MPEAKPEIQIEAVALADEKADYYDARGKIDPFVPLIQEKTEAPQPVVDDNPQRILTPLEKIELNQIRLVAVIVMEKSGWQWLRRPPGKGMRFPSVPLSVKTRGG
nr:hypothetical protein [Desulfobacula sp.]